eukprot:jgi/Mesvir1/4599/Mv15826-RA.1
MRLSAIICMLCIAGVFLQPAFALKKKVHIPNDLSDVIDDEEDDEWKNWGKKKGKPKKAEAPPADEPFDPNNFDVSSIMNKRDKGPWMGFAKLKATDPPRTKADADAVGRDWAQMIASANVGAQVYAIDEGTLLISCNDGTPSSELRDFVLKLPVTEYFDVHSQKWVWDEDEDMAVLQQPPLSMKPGAAKKGGASAKGATGGGGLKQQAPGSLDVEAAIKKAKRAGTPKPEKVDGGSKAPHEEL